MSSAELCRLQSRVPCLPRPSVASRWHHWLATLLLRVLGQVSVYLQNWSHVLSYVSKAESTPEIAEVRASVSACPWHVPSAPHPGQGPPALTTPFSVLHLLAPPTLSFPEQGPSD